MTTQAANNKKFAIAVISVVVFMVGLAYAAVPLYEIFCRVTGYGGTTQVDQGDQTVQVIDRKIKVRFHAAVNQDMPWEFKPKQNVQTVYVGEKKIALYEAYNPTNKPITGVATFNVTPHKAGEYFVKIDCFCFSQQTLQPGERVDMPVLYYLDPSMEKDINMDNVHEVTLSYTFYVSKKEQDDSKAE